MRERRRYQRFNLRGKIKLRLGKCDYDLPAADISVSGIGVMLDIALFGTKPTGEVGVCHIESTDLATTIEAFVSVMSIRRVGRQYLIGLRFESISDEYLRVIRAYETLYRSRQRADRTYRPA